MAKHEPKHREEIATERFKLIAPLLDENLDKKDQITHMKAINLQGGPSIRTLKRYVSAYQSDGFEGLKPKERNLTPEEKIISEEIGQAAINARRENPNRSVMNIIFILESSGLIKKGSVCRATLQRYLQKKGFSKKQMNNYTKTVGKATRRYRKEHRMEQLQTDFKYAVYLPIGPGGKTIQTYWVAFIDNSSRMILDGKFYAKQSFYEVEDSFRRVIETYGRPSTILTDNGTPFRSKKLQAICAKLGIKIIYSKPYSPETKGLIERVNSSLDKFLSEATLEKYDTLEELNLNYDAWIEKFHNTKLTKALKGGTPKNSFFNDSRALRFVPQEEIVDAFSTRLTRKVNNDCTISIDGIFYDIKNPNLIGFNVEAIYDTKDRNTVVVRRDGFEDVIAHPLLIGSNVEAREEIPVEGRSILPTTESSVLKATRNMYAENNPDYDLELASKAADRNKKDKERNDGTHKGFHMPDLETEEDKG